ncbi:MULTISPECIES: GTP-binding protein [unclassified Streptomyces]|uniref:GTP-binding protein n=1 Tax=unclassified Streptomyces TaxID=2593676 RepID=UPI000AE63B63|nr:ATP/GTP-binding protein [Streptomyces sp. NBC_00370]
MASNNKSEPSSGVGVMESGAPDGSTADGSTADAGAPGGSAPGASAPAYLAPGVAGAAKIMVVGPLGVGKTTLIGTVSEIAPLQTEAAMTQAGSRVDTGGPAAKTTTTVALDFGRMTLGGELVLYLFGTPGQHRFLPAWRDLAIGALGGLALVDTRDLSASFDALGHLEDLDLPFVVAVNQFPDSPTHPEDDLRTALDLLPSTPLVILDARDRTSSVRALITLVRHLIHIDSVRELA